MRSSALTVAAVAIIFSVGVGVAGFSQWRAYERIPPVGEPTVEEVTPPGVALRLREQRHCDAAVAGFWATADPPPNPAETLAWFDERFGPAYEEASARLSRGNGVTVRVYGDVTVTAADRVFWVETYDTHSHRCLPDLVDVWAHPDIWARQDACDELAVTLWGVTYSRPQPAEPPAHWTVLDLERGRQVAHHIERPTVLYARDVGADWMRLRSGDECTVD